MCTVKEEARNLVETTGGLPENWQNGPEARETPDIREII